MLLQPKMIREEAVLTLASAKKNARRRHDFKKNNLVKFHHDDYFTSSMQVKHNFYSC